MKKARFFTKITALVIFSLSLIFTLSCSSDNDNDGYSGEYGALSHGDKSYKTVVIGDQTWMAENLNIDVEGSICANCAKYGRLYDWATAMALDADCNNSTCSDDVQSKHQGICPDGWHIPSNEDWDKLLRYVDGDEGTSSPYASETAGRYLKATSGWEDDYGNGTNSYGFSALPGGTGYIGIVDNDYGGSGAGDAGYWWSASERDDSRAYYRRMHYANERVYANNYDKSELYSVRCLQN